MTLILNLIINRVEFPDDYEVDNYLVGMKGTQPALCKIGENHEVLLVLDEESGY